MSKPPVFVRKTGGFGASVLTELFKKASDTNGFLDIRAAYFRALLHKFHSLAQKRWLPLIIFANHFETTPLCFMDN